MIKTGIHKLKNRVIFLQSVMALLNVGLLFLARYFGSANVINIFCTGKSESYFEIQKEYEGYETNQIIKIIFELAKLFSLPFMVTKTLMYVRIFYFLKSRDQNNKLGLSKKVVELRQKKNIVSLTGESLAFVSTVAFYALITANPFFNTKGFTASGKETNKVSNCIPLSQPTLHLGISPMILTTFIGAFYILASPEMMRFVFGAKL